METTTIKRLLWLAFVVDIVGLLLLIFIAMSILSGNAHAGDYSTWRYGSPNDVRQAGLRAARCGNGLALATWMDIAFRAGSPELYRYTQPAPAQINIYNNVTIYGSGGYQGSRESTGTIDYNPPPRAETYRVPNYPKELLP